MRHNTKTEHAVSPVIGVMLMIVVTIIIAAIVSAFAGNFSGVDKKAPNAVISAEYLPWVEIPEGNSTGILFTEESGDTIDLSYVQVVLACGDESIHFSARDGDSTPYGQPHIYKVGQILDATPISRADYGLNTGNQFLLAADNNGNGKGVLGWATPSEFYLKNNSICTYTIVDTTSQQTLSGGKILI